MKQQHSHKTFWQIVWKQYSRHTPGMIALVVLILFCLVGIYAPFLASSKPLFVNYDGTWYFPLFRYLFYKGFYTKYLDLFYNLLMFTLPLGGIIWFFFRRSDPKSHFLKRSLLGILIAVQFLLFIYLVFRQPEDPGANALLNQAKQLELQSHLKRYQEDRLSTPPLLSDWQKEISFLPPYGRLNLILLYQNNKRNDQRLRKYQEAYEQSGRLRGKADLSIPSLWHFDQLRLKEERQRQQVILEQSLSHEDNGKSLLEIKENTDRYERARAQLKYLQDQSEWLEQEQKKLSYEVMPLIRPYHWEEDAGGEQDLNQVVDWMDLTRINRKDLISALIFGIRISLAVGILAIGLALLIGIPLGAIGGYYGGKVDLFLYRAIEIWESMPTFFMLLMVVAFLQSKSIFLVIGVIGLFGWTGFSRFTRGEFFKQKELPYVEACRAMGFGDGRIMFVHLLPNAIPPLLTLVPFAIMGAITSEAGLSFLGLGEEGSASWGVLMDEGRSAFPSESYLLWPPATLLTLLLVSIAIVGDALRDALDPKMK